MDDVSAQSLASYREETKRRTTLTSLETSPTRIASTVRTRATITFPQPGVGPRSCLAGLGLHVSIGFQVAHSASRRDIAT